jgi:hypothetical protein
VWQCKAKYISGGYEDTRLVELAEGNFSRRVLLLLALTLRTSHLLSLSSSSYFCSSA